MDIRIYRILVVLMCVVTSYSQDIEVHPEGANVLEEDDHILRCLFKTKIGKCAWFWAKSDPVAIMDRYEYLNTTAKGENTANCSIIIRKFNNHDAKTWYCSYAVASGDSPNSGAISNKAILGLEKRNISTVSTLAAEDPGNSIDNNEDTNFLGFGFSKTYVIIMFVGGTSFLIFLIVVSIFCYRMNKDKEEDPEIKSSVEEVTYNNFDASTSPIFAHNLLKYSGITASSLSICTNCHQLMTESSIPGSIKSTPRCKSRNGALTEGLSSDVTEPCASGTQHRLDSVWSLPSISESLYSYESSEFLDKNPKDNDFLPIDPPTSATSTTTANPLYESASGARTNKETRMFFPTTSNVAYAVVKPKELQDTEAKNDENKPNNSPTSATSTTTVNPLYESASGARTNKETMMFFPTTSSTTSALVKPKELQDAEPKNDDNKPNNSPTSATSTTTVNPLYESASGARTNKETIMFFPTTSSATSAVVKPKELQDTESKNDNKPKIQHQTGQVQDAKMMESTSERVEKSLEICKNDLASKSSESNKNSKLVNCDKTPESASGNVKKPSASNQISTHKDGKESPKNNKMKEQRNKLEEPDVKDLYENLKYRGSHIL